jgi:hypothetical protein
VSRAIALLALLAGCGPSYDGSTTCGRGRCIAGTTCVSTFGSGRQNQGWNDPRYPNVLDEWWCERTCPSTMTCTGQCLEDPADSSVVVCETDHVDVIYYSAGTSCLCDANHFCQADQQVTAMDVIDQCSSSYNVLMSCLPNMDCPMGTFHAGDAVPAVRLYSPTAGTQLIYCPGNPSNHFASTLPDGKTLRIYADDHVCP